MLLVCYQKWWASTLWTEKAFCSDIISMHKVHLEVRPFCRTVKRYGMMYLIVTERNRQHQRRFISSSDFMVFFIWRKPSLIFFSGKVWQTLLSIQCRYVSSAVSGQSFCSAHAWVCPLVGTWIRQYSRYPTFSKCESSTLRASIKWFSGDSLVMRQFCWSSLSKLVTRVDYSYRQCFISYWVDVIYYEGKTSTYGPSN